jgi:predicted PurR-regulated permease PerM
MIKKFKDLYNEEYSVKSIYVIKTAMIIFILGMIVYYLAGRTGSAMSFLGAFMKPLILGMCFAYLLSPLTSRLEDKVFCGLKKDKTRRVLSVLLTVLIVLVAIVGLIMVVVLTITKSVSALNFADMKAFVMGLAAQFEDFWDTIQKTLESLNINLGSVGDMVGKIFSGVKNVATLLLFAMIFAIYFLLDSGIRVYWGDVLNSYTSEKTRTKLKELAEDADKVFSGYIRGQSFDALLVGIMVSIALLIAGVPYAVVIGILTGVGNLIPYVGPVVGFGSLIVVCIAEGSVGHLIVGGIILILVMFVDGNIINPRVLSSSVEVHPVLVIVALLAGGRVGGIVGMLVSVPVAAFLKIQFEKYLEARKARMALQEQADPDGMGE